MDDDLYDNPTETEIVTQPLHPPLAEWISKQFHHNRSSVEFHKLLLVLISSTRCSKPYLPPHKPVFRDHTGISQWRES